MLLIEYWKEFLLYFLKDEGGMRKGTVVVLVE
jgi:hypothetical protein